MSIMKDLSKVQRIGRWYVLWEVIGVREDWENEQEYILRRFAGATGAASYACNNANAVSVRMGLYKPEWMETTEWEN